MDASLVPYADAKQLSTQLKAKGAELVGQEHNLIDSIWHDRPSAPSFPIIAHPLKYAGRGPADKLTDLRVVLTKQSAAGIVITSLDEIAWLYNLRGSDVPFNPIFFAYSIVTESGSTLFLDAAKMSTEVKDSLPAETRILPYGEIFNAARELGASSKTVLITSKGSWALASALGDKVKSIRSPIAESKSIKNDVEMRGMKDCHVRDGLALCEYFHEMSILARKGAEIDEVDAATILEQRRAAKDHFMGLSFPTISSTGANGAIIHYKPEKDSCKVIDWQKIYLCDSGAQYKDGTTDITRTWHFSSPTGFEKQAFTLVLKGHIAIAQLVFPRGTTGYTIDSMARQFLWREGLDYFHGTSHGVGSFLNVHEPPIGIGTRIAFNDVAFSAGNVISNEPGFYLDGKFGIRIENIIQCIPKKTTHNFGGREYLGFETISFAPLCRKLIEPAMLSESEKTWVNDYHKLVYKHLSPQAGQDVLSWLEDECKAI